MLLTQAEPENANPLIPTVWEAITVLTGLVIAALVSIIRNRKQPPLSPVLWILVVFAVPVLGPLLWFLAGLRSSQTASTV
ncbi:PLD nuclease N-terminal domain-containing protein [Arthrobacter sp. NPDC058288]|uniref:PLD nuclease N-terminal domain-containing protein n=1 Tax=Arthrobacter sp. NPDC058288 TaxID=3346424 RepID=UPI0036F10DC5